MRPRAFYPVGAGLQSQAPSGCCAQRLHAALVFVFPIQHRQGAALRSRLVLRLQRCPHAALSWQCRQHLRLAAVRQTRPDAASWPQIWRWTLSARAREAQAFLSPRREPWWGRPSGSRGSLWRQPRELALVQAESDQPHTPLLEREALRPELRGPQRREAPVRLARLLPARRLVRRSPAVAAHVTAQYLPGLWARPSARACSLVAQGRQPLSLLAQLQRSV